jgi:hypothetical protein
MTAGSSRGVATAQEFKPLEPHEHQLGWKYNATPLKVHVEGWNKGAVFMYCGTEQGSHRLITPTSGKKIHTRNRLLHVGRIS